MSGDEVVDMGWDDETTLYEAVLQSLGAASVCWDEAGVFMPHRAAAIGDALTDFISARFMPVPDAEADA